MRKRKAPKRFGLYLVMVTSITNFQPTTFEQAADQQVRKEAMQEEYDSIMQNDV
jgi:parvulin-like peptidyl-prolyl isomerase